MRFTLIKLRRHPDHWALSILPNEDEREATQTKPHPLGFYYAPRRYTVQTSLTKLRNRLIDDRHRMIKALEREITELEGVQLADDPAYQRPTIPLHYQFPAANLRRTA